jgi:aryl-alcohol dehydrogenase-like predicted oxidoreductase
VHDFNDLLGKQGKKYLYALQELKRRKIISKIGVSIYDPDEIGKIWKIWKPDIVQFPLNVFDNRILYSGWIDILKKFQIKMYARSVFLQGLLINNSDSSEFNKSYKFCSHSSSKTKIRRRLSKFAFRKIKQRRLS